MWVSQIHPIFKIIPKNSSFNNKQAVRQRFMSFYQCLIKRYSNTKSINVTIINFVRKDFLEILWLKKIIPEAAPIIPPNSDIPKSIFSEIRHWCFRACHLSNPKAPNAIILIINKKGIILKLFPAKIELNLKTESPGKIYSIISWRFFTFAILKI